MLFRTIIIICFILVNFQVSYARVADETIKGKEFDFKFSASEINNLLYQLNCLAGHVTGSDEAYKDLWATKLQWSSQDQKQLERWQKLWEKYHQNFNVIEQNQQDPKISSYPLNYPYYLDFYEKLQIAGFEAKDLQEYQHNLVFIVKPSDINEFVEIIRHFQPRFHSWWIAEAKTQVEESTKDFIDLINRKALVNYCGKVAKFYGAKIPENHTVYFNLVFRPKTKNEENSSNFPTSAILVENYAVIEIVKGEKPEQRIDVVLHEVFHYFYSLAPIEKQVQLLEAFLKSSSSYSLGLYSILDEALATAIGNGLVTEMMVDKSRFEKYFSKDKSFYNEYFIDKASKSVLRLVERRIAAGQTIFDAFADEYISIVSQSLSETVASPLLDLKSRGMVYYDNTLQPLANKFNQSIRGINTSTTSFGGEWPFETQADLGGVVFLYSNKVKDLSSKEGVFGKETILKLEDLTKKYKAFIYRVRRTSKANIYIFIGDDASSLETLLDSFKKSDKPFQDIGHEIIRF
ncbi:MAG: hypothetical protein FD167_4331, partial [bacterium]